MELKKESIQMLRAKSKATSQVTFDVDYRRLNASFSDFQIFFCLFQKYSALKSNPVMT